MKYRRQSHCVYYTRYHVVISVKYRRKILKWGVNEYIKRCLHGISKRYPEIEIEEVNSDLDHMHMLIGVAPKMALSAAVNVIKSYTARMARKKFKWLSKVYWDQEGIWSIGYFVSTVGMTEEAIRKYIEYQGKEDSGQAELEF
jgi:putative transposase